MPSAQRLTPHVTELRLAAGGAHVVGAINFSHYPEAAKKFTVVGCSSELDSCQMPSPERLTPHAT